VTLLVQVVSFTLVLASATPLLSQERNDAATERNTSAPTGHRQPTIDSVNKATAGKTEKPTSQPRGRDLGGELTICRGC
jgi:hypothetical protein